MNYDGNFPYKEGQPAEPGELKTIAVKTLPANLWGLYEMHGNVYEWCEDWRDEYEPCIISNPKGPLNGLKKILRGGCWNSRAKYLRSACRENIDPLKPHCSGFRFCCAAQFMSKK